MTISELTLSGGVATTLQQYWVLMYPLMSTLPQCSEHSSAPSAGKSGAWSEPIQSTTAKQRRNIPRLHELPTLCQPKEILGWKEKLMAGYDGDSLGTGVAFSDVLKRGRGINKDLNGVFAKFRYPTQSYVIFY